ncbi:ferrochelatase [Leptospira sp. GIMC2001]|uniref:ferrochelatase n=1 Tax=Leptospira sp. GIMC2001 TaxID=1513297 RepID=UPI002349F0E9|nr:ferrochelatase [Leptospira sp. GIMC2001]WCL49392.1 ferrochelatase [Leptospira sp. GIMC2001]
MTQQESSSVTLINLGGPANREEIEKFLLDLFLDPYVFDLPLWEPIRKKLAKFIAVKRAPKVAEKYASMGFGGGSPLVSETKKQADAVASILSEKTNKSWTGKVAMACGYPNIRDLSEKELTPSEDNIIIPLFPQFSRSTTLSIAKIFEEKLRYCPIGLIGWVDGFAIDPKFQKLTADFILEFFKGNLDHSQFIHLESDKSIDNWKNLDLVFSAHGIPMRLINKGDRYVEEMKVCIDGIEKALRTFGFLGKVHLSFQSRVGPSKWTEPNTIRTVTELGKQGKNIAIYPISFVSDHLETLEEIGVELRDIALEAGANSYHRIPAFGTYASFMEYLADLSLLSTKPHLKEECLCLNLGGEVISKICHARN